MAAVTETLLRWRPSRGGPAHQLLLVTDDADFDVGVDSDTGLPVHYNAIIRMVVNSPRGGRFAFGAKGRLKSEQVLTGPQANHPIPLAGRVTTEDFSWDFTPDHAPVLPGSVSVPSLLTSGGIAVDSTSDTTAAFTPTARALLVVAFGTTGLTHTYTNTHTSSGAWAQVNSEEPGAGDDMHSQARCQMGASPGSGTINVAYGGTTSRKSWIVAEVTGHNLTTPLSESAIGGAATGTTLSIALGGVAAGNMGIGTIMVRGTSAITVGTGETELAEAASGGATEVRTQMQYSTDATQNWSWTGSDINVGVVIEYAAATGPRLRGIIGG